MKEVAGLLKGERGGPIKSHGKDLFVVRVVDNHVEELEHRTYKQTRSERAKMFYRFLFLLWDLPLDSPPCSMDAAFIAAPAKKGFLDIGAFGSKAPTTPAPMLE